MSFFDKKESEARKINRLESENRIYLDEIAGLKIKNTELLMKLKSMVNINEMPGYLKDREESLNKRHVEIEKMEFELSIKKQNMELKEKLYQELYKDILEISKIVFSNNIEINPKKGVTRII